MRWKLKTKLEVKRTANVAAWVTSAILIIGIIALANEKPDESVLGSCFDTAWDIYNANLSTFIMLSIILFTGIWIVIAAMHVPKTQNDGLSLKQSEAPVALVIWSYMVTTTEIGLCIWYIVIFSKSLDCYAEIWKHAPMTIIFFSIVIPYGVSVLLVLTLGLGLVVISEFFGPP